MKLKHVQALLRAGMRPRIYAMVDRAVEDGVRAGLRRARKHTEHPSEEQLAEAVQSAVMTELAEWFHFEEDTHD